MSTIKKGLMLICTLLFSASFAFPVVSALVQVSQSKQDMLEGDTTITIYPDGFYEVSIVGSSMHALDPWDSVPPFYNVAFVLVNSPVGVNLTEVSSALVIKLGPDFAETLAALGLDIRIQVEGKSVEVDISFDLLGYAAVNGRIDFVTNDQMSEGVLNAEVTVKIWYTVYPKEQIEMFIESFPLLKAQLLSAVSEATEGKLIVRNLVIVDSEVSPVMATITFRASVEGELTERLRYILEGLTIQDIDLPGIEPGIDFDVAMMTSLKSADLQVSFDNEELAFNIALKAVIEGDIDSQFNQLKNSFLEKRLYESEPDPEAAEIINNTLLPTELSIVDLNATIEYSLEEDMQAFDFSISGLMLKPPTIKALLTALQKASEEVSQPSFTLSLEGGSEGKSYVEIVVPESTSEPILKEPSRVVWAFDDIENLNQVIFEVKEEKTAIGFTPQVAVQVVGALAAIAVVAFLLTKRM